MSLHRDFNQRHHATVIVANHNSRASYAASDWRGDATRRRVAIGLRVVAELVRMIDALPRRTVWERVRMRRSRVVERRLKGFAYSLTREEGWGYYTCLLYMGTWVPVEYWPVDGLCRWVDGGTEGVDWDGKRGRIKAKQWSRFQEIFNERDLGQEEG